MPAAHNVPGTSPGPTSPVVTWPKSTNPARRKLSVSE